MTRVLLYWSHICVLYNGEKQFLEGLRQRLLGEDIQLEVRYFGLGYPEHMSEYLAREGAELPDMIVSADLEVFEDRRIFDRLSPELLNVRGWAPLRACRALDAVSRGDRLLPFVAIPLVYYTRDLRRCEDTSLKDWDGLAFGGINNSAGKSIVKAVWSHYGKAAAESFLERSSVSDMPIGAFQAVRTGAAGTALVPSLYALRADGESTFLRVPREGPLLIPTYLCARSSAPERALRKVAEGIVCPELCDFYAGQGDLIVLPNLTEKRSRQEGEKYILPEREWLGATSPEEFYALYKKYLPSCTGI